MHNNFNPHLTHLEQYFSFHFNSVQIGKNTLYDHETVIVVPTNKDPQKMRDPL